MESSAYTAVKTSKCCRYGFLCKAAILKAKEFGLINLFIQALFVLCTVGKTGLRGIVRDDGRLYGTCLGLCPVANIHASSVEPLGYISKMKLFLLTPLLSIW
jgi:hypothetical protein